MGGTVESNSFFSARHPDSMKWGGGRHFFKYASACLKYPSTFRFYETRRASNRQTTSFYMSLHLNRA